MPRGASGMPLRNTREILNISRMVKICFRRFSFFVILTSTCDSALARSYRGRWSTSSSNIARPRNFMGRVGSRLTQRRYYSSSLSFTAAALRVTNYYSSSLSFTAAALRVTNYYSLSLSFTAAALRVITYRAQVIRNLLYESLLFELEFCSSCSTIYLQLAVKGQPGYR